MKTLSCLSHKNQLLIGIAISTLLIPPPTWSQKNQLAYDASSKIALVDHSRIRNEYKAFCLAKTTMSNAHIAKKKAFDNSIKDLDAQEKFQLKADAKKGSKNKDLIIRRHAARKAQLIKTYKAEQKKMNESSKAQLRAYENKIVAVIEIVVSRGGFTEVKALKNGETRSGIDITIMILEKLN